LSIRSQNAGHLGSGKGQGEPSRDGVSFADVATGLEHGRRTSGKGRGMRKSVVAEAYRDIDFKDARRGAVIKAEPGKTKISIRLDNRVLDHFRSIVEQARGGNYQTLINDALVACIQQKSVLEAVRQVVREEIGASADRQSTRRRQMHSRRGATAA
jgi:uncharacterized protein (DUF4415 family)